MKNGFAALAAFTVVAGGISFASVTPADAQVQTRGAPRGSYAQSCTGSYVNQGRLYADCRDLRGNIRETSIELNRCSSSDIGNDNGLLVCRGHRGDYEDNGRPGQGNGNRPGHGNGNGNGNGWGGGWGGGNGGRGGSITVYRDSDYRGQSLTFDREVANLRNHGMNDAVSSIRFSRNSGTWEICTDANFRGRCERISSDTRDLTRLRLNDTISSMRPVGRGYDNYRPR
ncbi:hypothetical protein GCM10009093_17210 [Brevundimonas terrae]|uniref:Beta/gamma crystallin 'Greek key' domain-containing protein n=1 Tax=Brevundimonas terrae TaxID=363631 RepID=A0ABP3I5Z0_9CAUL|nr:beta/gamma crystallin-related protein [Brevundimonas terrae]NIJ26457.1 hypothetical protein [Brevundimonas terrae]